MLEASAFQALQAQAPYRGIIKPPVELVVHDFCIQRIEKVDGFTGTDLRFGESEFGVVQYSDTCKNGTEDRYAYR